MYDHNCFLMDLIAAVKFLKVISFNEQTYWYRLEKNLLTKIYLMVFIGLIELINSTTVLVNTFLWSLNRSLIKLCLLVLLKFSMIQLSK